MELEVDLQSLLNNEEHPVWDRPVPIVVIDGVYNCYISSGINEPYNYDELCFVLESVKEGEQVVLHINTYGGHIDSAFKVIASIRRCKGTVTARLTGTVASAGTIIALMCDEVEVEDFTHFMIHNYSTGAQGKGHEIMEFVNFNDKDLQNTFTKIYKGFLTPTEIKKVLAGRDMWLTADETRKRWDKKKETANG